jgi:valyl-tRNA synthetase
VRQTIEANAHIIRELARVERIQIVERVKDVDKEQFVSDNAGSVNVFVRTGGLIDIEAERDRLSRQLAAAEAEVGRAEARLADEQFRQKAPTDVVAREEEKLAAARSRAEALRQRLAEL